MRKKINFIGVLAVSGFIAYSSFQSGSATSVGAGSHSPMLHAAAYFGLASALLLYYHDTKKGHIEAIITAFLFGFTVEVLQGMTAYRFFAWIDVAANGLGASLIMLDYHHEIHKELIKVEDRFLEVVFAKLPTDF